MSIEVFTESELEQLSKALADCATGSQITLLLHDTGLLDIQGGDLTSMTKWKRINAALRDLHNKDQSPNGILDFSKRVLAPARFISKPPQEHSAMLAAVNTVLALKGVQIRDDGEAIRIPKSTTVADAQRRADRLRGELTRRAVHPEVLRFCRTELMDKDYFHAVLEASKSLAEKIRALSGLSLDGNELVDKALSTQEPLLVWNSLKSPSERAMHTGVGNMLKGVFSYYRNPTAHDPRILKPVSEEDALEALTLISFLHRRLEEAQRTTFHP